MSLYFSWSLCLQIARKLLGKGWISEFPPVARICILRGGSLISEAWSMHLAFENYK